MVPDLKFAEEIITPAKEAALIALIERSGLAYSSYDPGNRRSSTSYGWKYDYRNDDFIACAPLPEGFNDLAAKAAKFAGVRPEEFAECLLNRYEPGAIIQPHHDKPCWEYVVGISLGAAATMEFTRESDGARIGVPLPPRSIYLLAGDARHVWRHALPPMRNTRWSITFRTFTPEHAKIAAG